MINLLIVLAAVPPTRNPPPHVILTVSLFALALFVIGILIGKLKSLGAGTLKGLPYESRKFLLTPAERSFMAVLEQALEGKLKIMAQVRLADVVIVKNGLSPQARGAAFNRIQSKHLDFVVCDPKDFSILCAIELDDSSHAQERRQDRDAFVDGVMNAAGIKLHRFRVKQSYSVEEVRKIVVG